MRNTHPTHSLPVSPYYSWWADAAVYDADSPWGYPVDTYGSGAEDEQYYTGDLAWLNPVPLAQKAYGAAQEAGQKIAQAWPSLTAPITVPSAIEHNANKAGDAADTFKTQTNQVGDDARRTLAVAQAAIVAANRHIEETSQKAQATAEAIKYVVFGVGGLACAALLLHLVKQTTE